MTRRSLKGVGACLSLILMAGTPALAQTAAAQTDDGKTWRSYGQNPGATNFSPLTQITPDNVGQLKRAWTFRYGGGTDDEGDRGLDHRWEVTPLVIDGVMYVSTPTNPNLPDLKATITALSPETGEVLWKWESDRNIHGRGIAWWPGDDSHGPRIIF
ncbi:MAG TPA: hypothetical protein VLZ73_09770, partial [Brevundimonas sp.]|nr:hypothetical protein [Brevundimonas sp.]